jgi:hypothetical protein
MGVSIVQQCALAFPVMPNIAILRHLSERHISCLMPTVGSMVHPSTWCYALSLQLRKSVLNFASVLRLCFGPRAVHGDRWDWVRDAVRWLGSPAVARCLKPMAHFRSSNCYRHGYVLHFLHTMQARCKPVRTQPLLHAKTFTLGASTGSAAG